MGERADIYEMGLICWQLGLTPDTVAEMVALGVHSSIRGITQEDITDLWRIKVRGYRG